MFIFSFSLYIDPSIETTNSQQTTTVTKHCHSFLLIINHQFVLWSFNESLKKAIDWYRYQIVLLAALSQHFELNQ